MRIQILILGFKGLTSCKYCTWVLQKSCVHINTQRVLYLGTKCERFLIMLLAFGVYPPYTKEHIVCKKFVLFQVT